MQSRCSFPLDEVALKFASAKALQRKGMTKTQSNGVPENLCRNEVFHDPAISKYRHARIIIMRPEINLYSEAGYIVADCSRRTDSSRSYAADPICYDNYGPWEIDFPSTYPILLLFGAQKLCSNRWSE